MSPAFSRKQQNQLCSNLTQITNLCFVSSWNKLIRFRVLYFKRYQWKKTKLKSKSDLLENIETSCEQTGFS